MNILKRLIGALSGPGLHSRRPEVDKLMPFALSEPHDGVIDIWIGTASEPLQLPVVSVDLFIAALSAAAPSSRDGKLKMRASSDGDEVVALPESRGVCPSKASFAVHRDGTASLWYEGSDGRLRFPRHAICEIYAVVRALDRTTAKLEITKPEGFPTTIS